MTPFPSFEIRFFQDREGYACAGLTIGVHRLPPIRISVAAMQVAVRLARTIDTRAMAQESITRDLATAKYKGWEP